MLNRTTFHKHVRTNEEGGVHVDVNVLESEKTADPGLIRERNRLSKQRDASRDERDAELRALTAGVERLKAAILKGIDAALVTDELNRMGRRKADLEVEMAAHADETPHALLHPRLAQVYRGKIERLLQAFDTEGGHSEAQEIIRGLIDAVVMTPVDGVLHAEVKRDLATMLVLASETEKTSKADALEVQQVKLVAGTGFDRCRTRVALPRQRVGGR